MSTEAIIPVGSDNREHHPRGFSFLGALDACPGACRTTSAPKNLADAGDRGTELHAVMEQSVKQWMTEFEAGGTRLFEEVVEQHLVGLPLSDQKSIRRIVEEIKNFFVVTESLTIGVEERIDLLDPETGFVLSFGYYDVLLILGPNCLIIDYKFVRREIDEAQKNRQGHALAVAVWQAYPDVQDITVLFTLPDCTSTSYTFRRIVDQARLEAELVEILDRSDQPYKVLHAGEQCNYCKHRGRCPAALQSLQTMATEIMPMMVPQSFDVTRIQTGEQMALVRYWAAAMEPIIDAIKEEALKRALRGQRLAIRMGVDEIEYKVFTRQAPRKLASAIDIYKAIKHWMSAEAFICACDTGVTSLTKVAVQVIADRLLAEGKKPNMAQIERDLDAWLKKKELISQEEGSFPFLKRIKIKPE